MTKVDNVVQNKVAFKSINYDDISISPHNTEVEEILIGSILSHNEAMEMIEDGLSDYHFFVPMLGRIFRAIYELINKDQVANPLTIDHYFADDQAFIESGGKNYLLKLCEGNIGSSIVKDYSNLIIELFNKRELIRIADMITTNARKLDYDKDSFSLIEEIEINLYDITEKKNQNINRLVSFDESVSAAMTSAKSAHNNKGQLSGVSTGLIAMDELLGGLHKSDLIILAGRPSMGKTALATNIAFCAANKKATEASNVAFFSLEMSAEQLANRILAEQAQLSSDQIRRGKLSKEEFVKLQNVSKSITERNLFIDDTPSISIATLRTRARRLKRKCNNKLDLIVVDYLQLMRGNRKFENRVQEISEITQGLKSVAKELNVPILALSQLSRAVEQREDKRPHLSDLRESGTIEQDADVVIFIYRQEYYEERAEPKSSGSESSLAFHERYVKWQENLGKCKNIADVIVAKQRHGPIGSIQLHFESKFTKFSNLTNDEYQPEQN